MKHKYKVRVVGTATLVLDDAVVEAVDDDWRKQFFPLKRPRDVADHVAFNMMVNDLSLSEIDGFADRRDEEAVLTDLDWDHEDE